MDIECPSGMTCRLRKIKGQVLVTLAEQADDATPGGSFGTIVGGCWEGLIDRGPYPEGVFVEGAAPRWDRVLKGDLLYMLLRLRAASARTPDSDPGPWGPGDPYVFTARCQACNKPYEWEVLLSDLKVQQLSKESREIFADGTTYHRVEVQGVQYAFKLLLPDQDAPADKLRKQQKRKKSTFVDRMAAQLMGEDRSPFSSRDPREVTDAEYRDAFQTYTAYFGTFEIDASAHTVTHHVLGATVPNWPGNDQLRFYELKGDQLILRTPPMRGNDGEKSVHTLVWQKVV